MLLRFEDKAKSNDDGDIGPRGHVKHKRVINVGPPRTATRPPAAPPHGVHIRISEKAALCFSTT